MANYPGGWLSLQKSNPTPITKYLAFASITTGGTTTNGEVKNVTTFNNPTTAWTATPITLNAEPTINAVNITLNVNEGVKASAMNMQTLMANLTNAPVPMQNMLYVYGNPDDDTNFIK